MEWGAQWVESQGGFTLLGVAPAGTADAAQLIVGEANIRQAWVVARRQELAEALLAVVHVQGAPPLLANDRQGACVRVSKGGGRV